MDISSARSFMATNARVLDRRRFELLFDAAGAAPALAALDGYRNADGGYGWGLEPDLRAAESQPGGALHAFEVFAEIGPQTTPRAKQLCDWLAEVSGPDGGMPFAFPVSDPAGCAPFWTQAEQTSALQSSAFLAHAAWRVAEHDPEVAAHPWLERVTRYCLDAITGLESAPHAMVLVFAVQFLNAVRPQAPALLEKLGGYIPDSGLVPVSGGAEGEVLRPLHFAPRPDSPARALFSAQAVEADLDRLAAAQQADGGWVVDFDSYSPAAELEWRGYETIRAISILLANERS